MPYRVPLDNSDIVVECDTVEEVRVLINALAINSKQEEPVQGSQDMHLGATAQTIVDKIVESKKPVPLRPLVDSLGFHYANIGGLINAIKRAQKHGIKPPVVIYRDEDQQLMAKPADA